MKARNCYRCGKNTRLNEQGIRVQFEGHKYCAPCSKLVKLEEATRVRI